MPPPDFVCAIPLLAQSPLADFQKANTDTELYQNEPMTLYFRFDPQETVQSPIEDSRLGIVSVKPDGEDFESFDKVSGNCTWNQMLGVFLK
jgi:hypothetical protein